MWGILMAIKMCDLAHEFITLAEKQGDSIAPRMVGHRLMGMALRANGRSSRRGACILIVQWPYTTQ